MEGRAVLQDLIPDVSSWNLPIEFAYEYGLHDGCGKAMHPPSCSGETMHIDAML